MEGAKNAMYAQAGRTTSWSKVQPVNDDAMFAPQPPAVAVAMPEPPVVDLPDFAFERIDTAFEPQFDFMKPQEKCQELALAYVQMQKWKELYETDHGFARGTIFAELDLPFVGKGGCKGE